MKPLDHRLLALAGLPDVVVNLNRQPQPRRADAGHFQAYRQIRRNRRPAMKDPGQRLPGKAQVLGECLLMTE